MLKIGLTGGIGSGKTTVAGLFAAKGIPLLDADLICRELVEPGQPALKAIVQQFGEDLLQDGRLDRAKLREMVFGSSDHKRHLEAILHPLVYQAMLQRLEKIQAPYCILAIPLLLETRQQAFVDRVLVIDCSIEQQIQRVHNRDHLEHAAIQRMIDAQCSREARLAAADDVIENIGDMEQLSAQVDRLHEFYLVMTGKP